MARFEIAVQKVIEIELIEEAFTPEFLDEFAHCIHYFSELYEHAEYLARLIADGQIDQATFDFNGFVEGYGEISNFVREVRVGGTEVDTEILETQAA